MDCKKKNSFCFVCGLFSPPKHARNITRPIVESYQSYFVTTYRPNLWYVPDVVCDYCHRSLLASNKGTHRPKYVLPMTWLPRSEHSANACYFCLNQSLNSGLRFSNRETFMYQQVESVIPAVLRSQENKYAPSEYPPEAEEDLPMESPSFDEGASTSYSIQPSTTITEESVTRSEYQPSLDEAASHKIQHLISQNDFNDLVRDLNLSKRNSEILASRLNQWNLVAEDFKITAGRKRSFTESFDRCFDIHENLKIVYCNNIDELFNAFDYPHKPEEWRLFIDSSASSLKAVLVNNGNKFPSVPILYGIDTNETYETIKMVLELINYNLHQWVVCSDLKIVGILQGLKGGYASHQCFLCLYEGRKTNLHYINHQWKPREEYVVNEKLSRDKEQLVPNEKFILPPLHIKLGMFSSFTRALNKESEAFKALGEVFPKLTPAKIEAGMYVLFEKKLNSDNFDSLGVFNGPQIDKLLKSDAFVSKLSPIERRAFNGMRNVVEYFLGNKRSENYKELVGEMLLAFKDMRVKMSLKIHFFESHLDFFPENCGGFSDEQGERFHQDINSMEARFKGKSLVGLLGEYCWSICRDTITPHKRQSTLPHF